MAMIDDGKKVGYVENPSATDTILNGVDAVANPQAASAYSTTDLGVATGPAGLGIPVSGTASIFNPLYVFRYAKFSATNGSKYSQDLHKDVNPIVKSANGSSPPLTLLNNSREIVENPTASQLVKWSQETGNQNLGASTIAPAPFQWNDFLWCKWYGKIPNNRLLTLRRYPIPVEDNLQLNPGNKGPLVPLAQAVSWWGGESGNALSSILGINYGFNWRSINADVTDVTGNEVTFDGVLDAFGISNELGRKLLTGILYEDPDNQFAMLGEYERGLQEWVKDSYGDRGQYWNRVLGPVNVINSTQIRERGYSFSNDITVKFTYSLRSYNGINPKIAMLDLISNFLALTYNKAEFWGGAYRYFKKPGAVLPGFPTGKFETGDFVGGAEDVLQYLIASGKGKSEEFSNFFQSLISSLEAGDISGAFGDLASSNAAKNLLSSRISTIIPLPLHIRSMLDGRAVGEWHLTVGNPMNPVAVIGNLCVDSTKIEFSDSLGIDDFPTEVSFVVKLIHGRPRAKQDIESMFNLGAGDMYWSHLPPPSSAYDTYGDRNSIAANNARGNTNDPSSKVNTDTKVNGKEVGEYNNDPEYSGRVAESEVKLAQAAGENGGAQVYGPRVSSVYGEHFGKSPILVDYFRDLKTKE